MLLVGMVAAGPLVRGPGTWVIAAGCLLLAWQAGKLAPQVVDAEQPEPSEHRPWTPFLFSVAYLGWVWLLPIRLGDGHVGAGAVRRRDGGRLAGARAERSSAT